MADKEVTVPVPEERVAESTPGSPPSSPPSPDAGRGEGLRPSRPAGRASAPFGRTVVGRGRRAGGVAPGPPAPAAQELFDLLAAAPGRRFSGNEVAARLGLEKGDHGVAGILAWPGRYCRHLDRALPIATEGRPDSRTDYFMEPEVAALFAGPPAA